MAACMAGVRGDRLSASGVRLGARHWVLLAVNLALVVGFGAAFVARMNYEFLIYVGVIVLVGVLIAASLRVIEYPMECLAALTVWSAIHLAGGAVPVGSDRLYDVMLWRVSETLPVLRYDQVVHIWGFGTATLVMYCLVAHLLAGGVRPGFRFFFVLVMAGLGVGALNEIVEFLVMLAVPEAGVGGYVNTSLDLCANGVGAVIAAVYVRVRYIAKPSDGPFCG